MLVNVITKSDTRFLELGQKSVNKRPRKIGMHHDHIPGRNACIPLVLKYAYY